MADIICPKCSNRGYYEMLVKQPSFDSPLSTMMFCVCSSGKQFRQITIEMRLGDLEDIAEQLIPALEKVKDSLHKPDEAAKWLSDTMIAIKTLIAKIEATIEHDT